MTYDATLKQSSTMKATMNAFLAACIRTDSKAIVIDAETLQSSKALVARGLDPANIVVINDNKHVIESAHKAGHTESITGISTNVLAKLHSMYDCIYLDYCGTPDPSQNGWDPRLDMYYAADKLNDSGICIVTFTNGRTENAVIKATNLIPNSLHVVHVVHYRETSPMFSIILTKTTDLKYPKMLLRRYNEIAVEKKASLQMKEKRTKKRCNTLDIANGRKRQKKGQRVCVLWGNDTRKKYKQYVGKEYYGIVSKPGKKGWVVKWDDGGTTDISTPWITWL
tara:strand:- start:654 stop:1496 length:843 start_codon:yes stop_codon:yes gene_type:complete